MNEFVNHSVLPVVNTFLHTHSQPEVMAVALVVGVAFFDLVVAVSFGFELIGKAANAIGQWVDGE